MKKTSKTILYVFLIMLAVLLVGFTALVVWFFFSLHSSSENDGYTYMGRGDYSEVLFGDISFFRTSSVDGAITRGGSTELDGYIFKYANDSARYVAAHVMTLEPEESYTDEYLEKRKCNGSIFCVLEDNFVLLDTVKHEKKLFDTEEELLKYCSANSISLGNWSYPSGGDSIHSSRTELVNGYSIESMGKYRGQSVCKDEIAVFSGHIDACAVGEEYIAFHLMVADDGYDPEYPNAVNSGLKPLSETPLHRYRYHWYASLDVYYDQYILLNTATGEAKEFDGKRELNAYDRENSIKLNDWMKTDK